jgi:putative ABC transport system substrate-binding protein
MSLARRDFITLLGGTAAAWPLAARAQQVRLPVIAFISGGTANAGARNMAAFRKGLSESGIVEGQNVMVEYHWLEGDFDALPALAADLVQRRVAVIATPGATAAAVAARAATATIPIVFGIGEDPVKRGLVASLARPGGNMTGINWLTFEAIPKQLALLHDLVPKAARIAVLVNPRNPPSTEPTLEQASPAARALGLDLQVFNAGTAGEIDAAFAAFARTRVDALFVASDAFLGTRRGQFATLAARDRLPTCTPAREFPEAGALMSYGTSVVDMYRQVGVYAGSILKGVKPADLPVMQSTRFEFVLNLQTAKALGIDVSPMLLAIADEVIE